VAEVFATRAQGVVPVAALYTKLCEMQSVRPECASSQLLAAERGAAESARSFSPVNNSCGSMGV
jgi:hypothetical protein